MYTAGRAAELTGVPRETLRKWEQRYGVVTPIRTDGNYRLYDDEAVRRIATMRDLVDAGWAPRDAARHVVEQPAATSVSGTVSGTGAVSGTVSGEVVADPDATATDVTGAPASDGGAGSGSPHSELDELVGASLAFDQVRVEHLLDKAFAEADPAVTVDQWLLPSLARLGEAWRRGTVSIAGEHFVTGAVVRRLAQEFQQLPHAPAGAPRVIVGLARGSRHELGVLAFATVLRGHGVDVTYLGPDLPVESWVDTVRTLAPAAVVIGAPIPEDLPAVREAVQALAPHTEVFLGGAQQEQVEGATPLGHHVGDAAAALAARLRQRG